MYNYKDKDFNVRMKNEYFLLKTLSMFHYEGLPGTIPPLELERMLQTKGYSYVTQTEQGIYALYGSLGGVNDAYDRQTNITINNPYLKFNRTLDIENDGVLIKNDALKLGLLPLIDRYNTLMNENEVTMFVMLFNARIPVFLSAGDDQTKESAEQVMKKVEDGEIGVIGENKIFDGIQTHVSSSQSQTDFTKLLELNQYVKASLYNELGLQANYNMKRERLNKSEVEMNNDGLFPLVDNMLNERQQAVNKINEKYGFNITVELNSSWEREETEGGDDNN